MRITGGSIAGRRIEPLAKMPHTRPTTAMAREALLNILDNRLEWSSVCSLELFAGTGIFSYECLSRGAKIACMVEKNPFMAKFISRQIKKFQFSSARLIVKDVLKFLGLPSNQFQLIIADPPYDFAHYQLLHQLIFANNFLASSGLCVIEHRANINLDNLAYYSMRRKYGDSYFSFFSK